MFYTLKASNPLKALLCNFLFAAAFAFLIVLPDFITELFLPKYDAAFDPMFLAVMFGAGLLLSFNKSRLFFFIFSSLVFMLILPQLANILYFGYPLAPAEVHKIFTETSDIVSGAFGDIEQLWLLPFAILIPFTLLAYAFYRLRGKMFSFPFAFILILLLFVPKIERATRKDIKHFLPSPIRYAIHNGVSTFSFYVGNEIWSEDEPINLENIYKPYAVKKGKTDLENIILVIGESVNPDHLSLFGYPRDTTPFLKKLSKQPEFDYKHAISGGVSTHSGLAFFMNGVREPGNIEEIKNKTFNLFRLAKEQGFSTFFISAQDAKNAYEIGSNFVDGIETHQQNLLLFNRKRDLGVIDILEELPLGNKNFIVVQLRSPHSPYEENYDENSEFDVFNNSSERVDTYDNAILFFDKTMEELYEYSGKISKDKKWYFIFTSDHGQAFGENGFYGHNKLDMSVANVPFFAYSNVGNEIKEELPSHYEIAEWIGGLLGYTFENPNMQDGTFFIHGNNFFSNYEFIQYAKKDRDVISQKTNFLKDVMISKSPNSQDKK